VNNSVDCEAGILEERPSISSRFWLHWL